MFRVVGDEKGNYHLVNPEQAIVIAFDQPLFALAKKKFKWVYPDKYGSDKFVMMGGLNIEMLVLKLIGDWLEDSGWTQVIHNSGIIQGADYPAISVNSLIPRTKFCFVQRGLAKNSSLDICSGS